MLATRIVSQTTFMFLGQKVKAHLRGELTRHVSETRWLSLERAGMAKTVSVLTQDLDTLVVFFVSLPNLFIYGAVIIGCLIYLATLSASVLALALVAIALGTLGYRAAHGRAIGLLRRSRQREDTLIQQCKKLFDGGREYRLNAARRQRFVYGELADNIEAVRRERTRGYVLYGLATSWGSILFFAFIGLVLFGLRDSLTLDPAAITIFLYMIVPVEGVLSSLPTIASARVALQRVQHLRDHLPPEQPQRPLPAVPFRSLTLQEVRYQYQGEDGERFTLGPLNLQFTPGELVFVVGGNGSGKTTLANLLVGLYPPDSATWDNYWQTNVMSGVRLSRGLLPAMVSKGWGRVVFISSESARNIPADMIHYGVTKTAQLSLARGLAKYVAGSGVTVNSVLPGPTISDGFAEMLKDDVAKTGKSLEELAKAFVMTHRPSSVIQRAASVAEVANMVVYVCSPQASATSGAALRVDGGVVDDIL